jgi:hypothetical protein
MKIQATSEWVLQYTHPRNIPAMNAPIACQGLRCITAKKKALHRMALIGVVCLSKPLSIIPLSRNSSITGAAITVVMKAQNELLRIFSNISFIDWGIGSQLDKGSVTKLSANIAIASIGYTARAPVLPKLAFSRGIASEVSLLHSIRYAMAGIIGNRYDTRGLRDDMSYPNAVHTIDTAVPTPIPPTAMRKKTITQHCGKLGKRY